MSRVAYFKNVSPTVGLDATQNQMLNTLQGQIASKAEQADLVNGLSGKASNESLIYQLSSKADTSVVNASLTSIKDSLTNETSQRLAADTGLTLSIANANTAIQDTKNDLNRMSADVTNVISGLSWTVDLSVYNARIVNEAVFFDSIANSIVLQDVNGAELNYVALGLVPA